MTSVTRILLLWLLLAAGASAEPLQLIPDLHSRVTDLSATLSAEQQTSLETQLAQLEQDTGAQLAVLLVNTTAPEDIAAYAIRVVDKWKLGRKAQDDGVLFLVAVDDKRMRIEVGYGLEGALPDALASRIINTIVVPHFKQDDFAGGVTAGVDAIAKTIRGENLPPPERGAEDKGADIGSLLPVVLLLALGLGSFFRSRFGSLPGSLATGAITGVIAWLIVGLIGAACLAALVAFFICLFGGGSPGAWSNRDGGGLGGGSFGGGFGGGGGGFGGGGFGGGGFGGGGGGFGGGGASGGW